MPDNRPTTTSLSEIVADIAARIDVQGLRLDEAKACLERIAARHKLCRDLFGPVSGYDEAKRSK